MDGINNRIIDHELKDINFEDCLLAGCNPSISQSFDNMVHTRKVFQGIPNYKSLSFGELEEIFRSLEIRRVDQKSAAKVNVIESEEQEKDKSSRRQPTCFKCGEKGHIRAGCPLNAKKEVVKDVTKEVVGVSAALDCNKAVSSYKLAQSVATSISAVISSPVSEVLNLSRKSKSVSFASPLEEIFVFDACSSLGVLNEEEIVCVADAADTPLKAKSESKMSFHCSINDIPVTALLDTGATVNVISSRLVKEHSLVTYTGDRLQVSFADGRSMQLDQYAEVLVTLGSYRRRMQFLVLDTEDVFRTDCSCERVA